MINKFFYRYTQRQRRGLYSLIILLLCIRLLVFVHEKVFLFDDLSPSENKTLDSIALVWNKQYQDGLKSKNEYKYNINRLTSFQAYILGLPDSVFERIQLVNRDRAYFKSINQLQTEGWVDKALYLKLKNRLYVQKTNKYHTDNKKYPKKLIKNIVKRDLNKATAEELKVVKGIGPILSKRIVKYRDYLKGFTFKSQLNEVWGLNNGLCERIFERFEVKLLPRIEKVSLRTANVRSLSKLPYIDKRLAIKLLDYVSVNGEFKSLEQLKEIPSFPIDKYQRIVLYLRL